MECRRGLPFTVAFLLLQGGVVSGSSVSTTQNGTTVTVSPGPIVISVSVLVPLLIMGIALTVAFVFYRRRARAAKDPSTTSTSDKEAGCELNTPMEAGGIHVNDGFMDKDEVVVKSSDRKGSKKPKSKKMKKGVDSGDDSVARNALLNESQTGPEGPVIANEAGGVQQEPTGRFYGPHGKDMEQYATEQRSESLGDPDSCALKDVIEMSDGAETKMKDTADDSTAKDCGDVESESPLMKVDAYGLPAKGGNDGAKTIVRVNDTKMKVGDSDKNVSKDADAHMDTAQHFHVEPESSYAAGMNRVESDCLAKQIGSDETVSGGKENCERELKRGKRSIDRARNQKGLVPEVKGIASDHEVENRQADASDMARAFGIGHTYSDVELSTDSNDQAKTLSRGHNYSEVELEQDNTGRAPDNGEQVDASDLARAFGKGHAYSDVDLNTDSNGQTKAFGHNYNEVTLDGKDEIGEVQAGDGEPIDSYEMVCAGGQKPKTTAEERHSDLSIDGPTESIGDNSDDEENIYAIIPSKHDEELDEENALSKDKGGDQHIKGSQMGAKGVTGASGSDIEGPCYAAVDFSKKTKSRKAPNPVEAKTGSIPTVSDDFEDYARLDRSKKWRKQTVGKDGETYCQVNLPRDRKKEETLWKKNDIYSSTPPDWKSRNCDNSGGQNGVDNEAHKGGDSVPHARSTTENSGGVNKDRHRDEDSEEALNQNDYAEVTYSPKAKGASAMQTAANDPNIPQEESDGGHLNSENPDELIEPDYASFGF